MKKSDLKTGMRVRTRNDKIWLVVTDFLINGEKDILFAGEHGGWMNGRAYRDDLIVKSCSCTSRNYDVMEVYKIKENSNSSHVDFINLGIKHSIWRRQEYTDRQKEIFKALKILGFNWIARDKDNPVIAFDIKPERRSFTWYSTKCKQAELFTNSMQETFDFIKWEDEEPFEIPTL